MLWYIFKLTFRVLRAIMDNSSQDPVLFYGSLHKRRTWQLAWADWDVRLFCYGWGGVFLLSWVASLIERLL